MKHTITITLDCPSYWKEADVLVFMRKHCTPSELATLRFHDSIATGKTYSEVFSDETTGQVTSEAAASTPVTQKVLDK